MRSVEFACWNLCASFFDQLHNDLNWNLIGFYYLVLLLPWLSLLRICYVIAVPKKREIKTYSAPVPQTYSHNYNKVNTSKTYSDYVPLRNFLRGESTTDTHIYDTTEWFNKIIRKLWISERDYLLSLIFSTEQNIQSQYSSFKFQNIIIGDVPFRVTTIRCYELPRFALELDISYVGNCDLKFGIYSLFKGGIQNFQLHGTMRVLITPSIEAKNMGIEVYFIRTPTVNFDAIGVLKHLNYKNKVIESILDIINPNLSKPYKIL